LNTKGNTPKEVRCANLGKEIFLLPQVEQNRKKPKQGFLSLPLVLFAYSLQVFFLPAHICLGDHLLVEECIAFVTCEATNHEEHHVDEGHGHKHQHDHGCELFVQRLQPLQKRFSGEQALPVVESLPLVQSPSLISISKISLSDRPLTCLPCALGSRGPPIAA